MAKFFKKEEKDFDQEVLSIDRVSRMTAGGRRFSFRAVVAIGDRKGRVGLGVGKAKDISQAIEKAIAQAKKKIINVCIEEGTVPTSVIGHFKSAEVLLKPAVKGHGLIAGGVVRALASLAGIENLTTKLISRTNNKLNIGRAVIKAFKMLESYEIKFKNNLQSKKENGTPSNKTKT